MTYLVMETHTAYAVLLDENGRFLKAANLRYQVGDTVENIVELRQPAPRHTVWKKSLTGLAGLAACLCLAFFGWYQPNFTPYGTLRVQINPDVALTLSRTERVLEVEGLNADGRVLVEGYDYHGKDRDTAAAELVARAIDMGYLSGGETVAISVTSADADWQTQEEEELRSALAERYGETIVIQVGGFQTSQPEPAEEVVIPIPADTPTPSPTPSPTPIPTPIPTPPAQTAVPSPVQTPSPTPAPEPLPIYDDTDYGPGSDGVTDYGGTDDGPDYEDITDYDDWDGGNDDTDDGDDGDDDDSGDDEDDD